MKKSATGLENGVARVTAAHDDRVEFAVEVGNHKDTLTVWLNGEHILYQQIQGLEKHNLATAQVEQTFNIMALVSGNNVNVQAFV